MNEGRCTGCGVLPSRGHVTEAGIRCSDCRDTWTGSRKMLSGSWYSNGFRHSWQRTIRGRAYQFHLYPNGDVLVFAHRYGRFGDWKYGKHGRWIRLSGQAKEG